MEGTIMPPAVIGAVVAIGASGLAAASIITISTALIIGMAATAAGMLLTPKPKLPGMGNVKSQQERKQIVRSSAASCNVIYGTTMISGVLIFAEEQPGAQDDGEWLHMVVAIAGHPIHAITEFYIGDDKASTYGSNVKWALLNDLQQADPYLLQNCPSWKSDMVGKGVALVRVSLKFDQEKFPAGLPNLKFIVQGKEVWDPRTDTKVFTDNAALCSLDYHIEHIKIARKDMNLAEYISAANICDEIVKNGDGGSSIRYTVNGTFDVSEPFNDVLMDGLFQACGGEPTYVAGKHGIMVGAYYGPPNPNMVLTQHHIRGDISITPEPSFKDLANIIRGVYVDPKQDYNETDFPPIVMQEWLDQDGRELPEDYKFRFVTNPFTAQRLATISMNRKRVSRMMELPINLKGFKFRPGRFIYVDLPHLGIDMVEFRVTKWDFDPQSGITITVRQEALETYNDVLGKAVELPPLTNLRPETMVAPQNLSFSLTEIGEVVQGVLQWDNPQDAAYNNVVIFDSLGKIVKTIQVPGNRVQLNGLVKGEYNIIVYAFGFNGAKSSGSSLNINIQAPNAPTSIRLESLFYSVGLYPSSDNGNNTTFEYWMSSVEITGGDANILQKATKLGQGTFWTVGNINPSETYYFYIRCKNVYGISSFTSVSGTSSTMAKEILDIVSGDWDQSELGQAIKNLEAANLSLEDIIAQNKLDIELMNISIRKSFQEIGQVTFEIRETVGNSTAGIKRVEGAIATESEARAQSFEYLDAAVKGNKAELNTFKDTYANDQYAMTEYVQQLKTQADKNTGEISSVKTSVTTLDGVVNKNQQTMYAQFETVDSRITAVNQKVDTTKTDLEKSIATSTQNLQASINDTNAKVEQKMDAVVNHNGTVAATYTLRAGVTLPNGTYKSAGLFIGVEGGSNPIASVGVSADNFVVMNSRTGKLEAVFMVDASGNVIIRNALISKLFVEEAIVGSTLSSPDFGPNKGIQIDFKNGKIIANGGTWGAGLNIGNPQGKGLSITDQTILVRDENGRLRFACGYIKGLV